MYISYRLAPVGWLLCGALFPEHAKGKSMHCCKRLVQGEGNVPQKHVTFAPS